MAISRSVFSLLAVSLVAILLCGQQCYGQGASPSTAALEYFGKGIRKPIAKPKVRQQSPQTRPLQLSGGKPFENLHRPPTISPYLSLDTVESSVGLPNYYARVLPQIEQERANQAQAAKLRRLQQQIRVANRPGSISTTRNGGVPTTGHSSQFLNVGNYFPPSR